MGEGCGDEGAYDDRQRGVVMGECESGARGGCSGGEGSYGR